jgi:hypothetical protein
MEFTVWILNILWTTAIQPRPGYLVGAALYLFLRWKIYGEALITRQGFVTKELVDSLVPCVWTLYVIQVGLLVESYALAPLDEFIITKGGTTVHDLDGKAKVDGARIPLSTVLLIVLKLLSVVCRIQCLRHAHGARAKTNVSAKYTVL